MDVPWTRIRLALLAATTLPIAAVFLLVGFIAGGWGPQQGLGVAGFLLLVALVQGARIR